MIDQATWILQQYPWLQHIVMVMVVCRIVFKPLFAIAKKYVELTVEEEDNKQLAAFMKTKKYKMLAFIVDMLASVKLPDLKAKKCKVCGK